MTCPNRDTIFTSALPSSLFAIIILTSPDDGFGYISRLLLNKSIVVLPVAPPDPSTCNQYILYGSTDRLLISEVLSVEERLSFEARRLYEEELPDIKFEY